MKWLDALKIGLELMAAAEVASSVPLPVNWSWKVGKKRLRLKGELTAEGAG